MKELLKKLVRARSTLDFGELASAEVLAEYFKAAGVACEVDSWGENRANVVARVSGRGEKPPVVLACHIDVVSPGNEPWKYDPFCGDEIDGCIHGRGSVDMKGGTVAAAAAVVRIAQSGQAPAGDIIFAATAGEETDSAGAIRYVEEYAGDRPVGGVIIPEPTDFDIVVAHRGMFWLEILTEGKAAHSSMPHLGVNALLAMTRLIGDLEGYEIAYERHEALGDCSMSINMMSAGEAMNIVPDRCTLGIDIRTVPGQDHGAVLAGLQGLMDRRASSDEGFTGSVRVLRSVEPMETSAESAFVKGFRAAVGVDETKAVGFTTDGPHFATLGGPVLIFGPGKPAMCHKPDERIAIADVEKAAELYEKAIASLLG